MNIEDDQRLSGSLQDNILTLLCFNDENCKIVRAALTPQLFSSAVYKEIAGHAIDFIDHYGEAIKEHLPDHLDDVLNGDDTRKAHLYKKLLDDLFIAQTAINVEYVVGQLHQFVRLQTFKDGLMKAVDAVREGRIDQAEVAMKAAMTNQAVAFEAGLNLSKSEDIIGILDDTEEEGFTLGINGFDEKGIMPRRKELFTFMAARKFGKSWFISHVAKRALIQRWSVLIITLEMSEKRYATRMLQSFFSISKRNAEITLTRLHLDKSGSLDDLIQEQVVRMTMQDPNIRTHLTKRIKQEFSRRAPLYIKEFATGSLDLMQLNAYLDGLHRFENFVPDLICIDYPKLMSLDAKNLRLELGTAIEGIRGIGTTRNAAMVIVAQGNAEAERAQLVEGRMAAEDISIIATSDTVITGSRTGAEKKLGLARLYASQVRNEPSEGQVLITQAYDIGQFCLDSVPIRGDYFEFMDDRSAKDGGRRRRREEDDD